MALNVRMHDYRYEIIAPLYDGEFEPVKCWHKSNVLDYYANVEVNNIAIPVTVVAIYRKSRFEDGWTLDAYTTFWEILAEVPMLYVMALERERNEAREA